MRTGLWDRKNPQDFASSFLYVVRSKALIRLVLNKGSANVQLCTLGLISWSLILPDFLCRPLGLIEWNYSTQSPLSPDSCLYMSRKRNFLWIIQSYLSWNFSKMVHLQLDPPIQYRPWSWPLVPKPRTCLYKIRVARMCTIPLIFLSITIMRGVDQCLKSQEFSPGPGES